MQTRCSSRFVQTGSRRSSGPHGSCREDLGSLVSCQSRETCDSVHAGDSPIYYLEGNLSSPGLAWSAGFQLRCARANSGCVLTLDPDVRRNRFTNTATQNPLTEQVVAKSAWARLRQLWIDVAYALHKHVVWIVLRVRGSLAASEGSRNRRRTASHFRAPFSPRSTPVAS
jgi:hypothetical protein